jgi:hypothetical protein
MRQNEGLYRAARLAKRLVVGVFTLVVVVAAVGYFFLMRQVDPQSAWAAARREMEGGILRYGERPVRVARVYRRRPTNYFRAANGLLVATPQRVLFIGLEPRDVLTGADAPSAILTSEFPEDTLLGLSMRRIYWFTAHGLTLQRGNQAASFAASAGHEDELDSVAAYVARRQREQRAVAAADRALRTQLAELLKQPLHYVVQRGDALSTIAARYNATPEQIREWNHLPSDKVRIGATLLVRPGRK